jgi:uncharacterized membrane protein
MSSVCAIVSSYHPSQMVNGGLYFYISRCVGGAGGGSFGISSFLVFIL